MAVVKDAYSPIKEFEDWYSSYRVDPRTGCLINNGFSERALKMFQQFDYYKREMQTRVANYYKYEKQASAEVVSEKVGMPNVSSGDSAGFVERIAKSVIRHTPNVEIVSIFKEDSIQGQIAKYFLTHKIIGDDEYSNDMHQNLAASTEAALTLGFDCVIPVLQQDSSGSWYSQYDNINYRDVFPEPGAKDVRRANDVFIRRYLTKGDIKALISSQPAGWDVSALKAVLQTAPVSREYTDKESNKHRVNPEAYEIITWYSNSGDDFLTYAASTKLLLRIEKNKHPLKEHPVFFLILKRDPFQPLGKSILSKTFGRQEFQDQFLNGAMKLWARNIDPPIFGYGTINAIPNMSPGKYTQISNPNAKIEPFEVNTNALMMFGSVSQQNAANMGQLIGNADQQMAAQSTGGMMSQTPQGVEAQQEMIDITTNQFQKAVEAFFSKYLSYALTVYLQEMKGIKVLKPDSVAREALLNGGLDLEAIQPDGSIQIDLKELAVQYHVKIVPGSLVEMEKEKQIRLLNQMFVPLSQAMPAMAAAQNPEMLANAAAAMQFIIKKQIELSGSNHARELEALMDGNPMAQEDIAQRDLLEETMGGALSDINLTADATASVILQQQEQIRLLTEGLTQVTTALGIPLNSQSTPASTELEQ